MNFVPAGYPPGPFQPVPQPQVFHTVMVPQFAQPLPPQQQPTGLHQPLIPTQLHQPLMPQKAAPPPPQNTAPTFHALPSASGLIKSTRKYKNFNLLFSLVLVLYSRSFRDTTPSHREAGTVSKSKLSSSNGSTETVPRHLCTPC